MKAHLQACLRATTCCLLFALTALGIARTPPQNRGKNGVSKVATPTRTSSKALQATQVTPLGPFTGDHSETWEEFGAGNLPSGTSILGGIATISGTKMVTAHSFQMCSVFARPSDGFILMDQDRPRDLVTISFSQPVSAFGAYWGSGIDCVSYPDAATILTFRDVSGNVIGSDSFFYEGGGDLEWHGYTFGTPVKTITRTASDNAEGFATDGMQVNLASTPTPTPTPTPTNLKIISITHPAANATRLNCVGAPNVINRIEWSPDLSPGSFQTLASVMADANGAFQYDDTSAGTKKFYRVAYP